ncbi:MAG TPA: FtsW/RodA/SpoVE family cell cycle protein, partial [Firmicutes bacterium]|nr:FtsW/RodA/SpoVE family cell cycle protein [Bacillota bacterium]
DTDLIFGLLCEELGIIIGLCIAACYILLLWGAIRASKNARSSYYSIAACATAGLLIFQAALNIFGSTDVLPLTGVTLPFVSNGGSSMMSCWGILAFITAVLNNRSIKDFKNKESRLAAAK